MHNVQTKALNKERNKEKNKRPQTKESVVVGTLHT